MKKIFYILLLFMVIGCATSSKQSIKSTSVIDKVCGDFASDVLTVEEITHWDSLNAKGECLLIRGAERNLDTIVNHVHIIFINEP